MRASSVRTDVTDVANSTLDLTTMFSASNDSDVTRVTGSPPSTIDVMTIVMSITNGTICVVGIAGNALVMYVILRFNRMKTVTNVYIFNLSLTDFLFLLGLPMLITVALLRHWVFGAVMCRVYYALTCVSMFAGPFTLTILSADRFTAVWFPVTSKQYRTPGVAIVLSGVAWFVSLVITFPVVLYANQQSKMFPSGIKNRCIVEWPMVYAAQVYIGYTAAFGFVFPVTFICIFYALLVARLGAKKRPAQQRSAASAEHQRTVRRSVTFLVTSVIAVFILCWLPYWAFQVSIVFVPEQGAFPDWKLHLFQFLTALSYTNSAINPFLYAFTNESFKASFAAACRCLKTRSTPVAIRDVTSSNVKRSRRHRCDNAAACTSSSHGALNACSSIGDEVVGGEVTLSGKVMVTRLLVVK